MPEPEVDPYTTELIASLGAAVPRWLRHSVETRLRQSGVQMPDGADERIRRAAADAGEHVAGRLSAALAVPAAQQQVSPLSVVRSAVGYATEVLREFGVPEVVRSEFDERVHPEDVYALSPASWSDLGERVHNAGIAWGAWKAKQVLEHRRALGEG